MVIAPDEALMTLTGPTISPSPQLKLPSEATIWLRSGEKTGGLQPSWSSHAEPSGATCVIWCGEPPLTLAQICGMLCKSY